MMRLALALLALLAAQIAPPDLAPAPCDAALPPSLTARAEITCWELRVPFDSATPQGAAHTLAVMRVRVVSAPQPDPIVFLSGGPGLGMSAYWPIIETLIDNGLLHAANRDLILFDQRGVGASRPRLDCAQEQAASQRVPVDIDRLCAARHMRAGLPLDTYHTAASADDVDAIRAALGYETVNLYGHSYGTRLALAVMRTHPHTVRSALLESPFPPDARFLNMPAIFEATLTRVFATCAEQPACAAAYGDLDALFGEAHAVARARPEGDLTDRVLVQGLYSLLEAARGASPEQVEAFMRGIRDGDAALLQPAWESIRAVQTPPEAISMGVQALVNCADEAPFITEAFLSEATRGVRAELVAVYAPTLRRQFTEACRHWPHARPDTTHHGAVTAAIPTLIFSGTFDPLTSLENAQRTAASLPHAVLIPFAGWGHWPLGRGTPCAAALYAAFLIAPHAPPDTGCLP